MSGITSTSAGASFKITTIPICSGTLWKIFKSSESPTDYYFRLVSYYNGGGTYFLLYIKTLLKSKECAKFLIESPAKLYCDSPTMILKPECKGNITLAFPSSSSLDTFKNYCEVTGLLEETGFTLQEQQNVEQSQTQITYVHEETQKGGSDLTKFFTSVAKINTIFYRHFTGTKPVQCDIKHSTAFTLDREDVFESGTVSPDAPSPCPSKSFKFVDPLR